MNEDIKLEIFKNGSVYGWYLYDNRFHNDMESNYRWEKEEDAREHGDKMVTILMNISTDWIDMDMDTKQPSK